MIARSCTFCNIGNTETYIVARWPYTYIQEREIESDASTTKSDHILTIERGCTLKLMKDILCILAA